MEVTFNYFLDFQIQFLLYGVPLLILVSFEPVLFLRIF